MSGQPTLYSRRELVAQASRRLLTYTDEITYFGPNSVDLAIAETLGGMTSVSYRLYKALLRRFTLIGSSGTVLTEVAAERGARRQKAQRSRLLVVFVPWSTTVTAITVGMTTRLEVEDSSAFEVGDSIRIRNADGSNTERLSIIDLIQGTGPNGNDELEVGSLTYTYDVSEDTQVLLRETIPVQTLITTKVGVGFATTSTITIGDFNAVLSGEGAALALADKVWCEATTKGDQGNINPQSVTGLAVPNPNVRRVHNPERAFGGAAEETDFDLRYRAAHRPARASQETPAWAEALAVEADADVLRAVIAPPTAISTLAIQLLARNGGPLTAKRLRSVENYIGARVRGYMAVSCSNVTLVSIEVEAQVQLDPDVTLRQAWVDAGSRIANYIDYRRWEFGLDPDWTKLLGLVKNSLGVKAVVDSTFLPSSNPEVGNEQLPVFVRLSLQDIDTLETINGALAVSFDDSTET